MPRWCKDCDDAMVTCDSGRCAWCEDLVVNCVPTCHHAFVAISTAVALLLLAEAARTGKHAIHGEGCWFYVGGRGFDFNGEALLAALGVPA